MVQIKPGVHVNISVHNQNEARVNQAPPLAAAEAAAKAAPNAASPPVNVAAAAAELAAATKIRGQPTAPPPAKGAPGVLPPHASSTGRRYYSLLKSHHTGPAVACGQEVCLRAIGGSWTSCGTAPKGRADLESAINHIADKHPELGSIEVRWR